MPNSYAKLCELQLATTSFVNKLTALTLALYPSVDDTLSHSRGQTAATKNEQLQQQLLDLLKQWTDQLNSIGAASISSQTTASSAVQPTDQPPCSVQSGSVDRGVQALPKIPLHSAQPTPPTICVPTVMGNGLLEMAMPTSSHNQLNAHKKTAVPNTVGSAPIGTFPNVMPSAMRNSVARITRRPSVAGAHPASLAQAVCGISVQRRGLMSSPLRRAGPSNAYLSAGSKLYNQRQQQQQRQTPGMPPSLAYLSAGSKLVHQTLQQQQQLQRLVRRQQQKLTPPLPPAAALCSSSAAAADTNAVVAASVAAISAMFNNDANSAIAAAVPPALSSSIISNGGGGGGGDDDQQQQQNAVDDQQNDQQRPTVVEVDSEERQQQQ